MSEWMSEWMIEWMNEWMNERMKEWMSEWMSEWKSEWLTHSALLDAVDDLFAVEGRDPELGGVAVALSVEVEHVDLVVDGLHLAHLAQPHVHVLRRNLQ